MSSTTPVHCGDRMFWAYDVALGVLLAEAVHIAEETPVGQRPAWSDTLVRELRVHAVLGSDQAVLLDEFGAEERRALLDWTASAASRPAARGGVSRADVAGWDVLDGETIHLRSADHIAAAPLVELARALAQLASGTLEPAPAGRHWLFGTPAGRTLQGG